MEIYTEIPSAAARAALRKLGQWLDSWPRCCTSVLPEKQNGRFPETEPAGELGGRYWDRTSDLLGVNEALSR